jgi:hypothetical protein
MALRSVRLDDETEEALARVREATGDSVSQVIKTGIVAVSRRLSRGPGVGAYEIYDQLDLGRGGYARAPARKAKQAIQDILRRKHRR